MSAKAALFVALSAILILGAFAAWLLNIPVWVIGAFLVAGGLLIRRVFRGLSPGRARQETEAPE